MSQKIYNFIWEEIDLLKDCCILNFKSILCILMYSRVKQDGQVSQNSGTNPIWRLKWTCRDGPQLQDNSIKKNGRDKAICGLHVGAEAVDRKTPYAISRAGVNNVFLKVISLTSSHSVAGNGTKSEMLSSIRHLLYGHIQYITMFCFTGTKHIGFLMTYKETDFFSFFFFFFTKLIIRMWW